MLLLLLFCTEGVMGLWKRDSGELKSKMTTYWPTCKRPNFYSIHTFPQEPLIPPTPPHYFLISSYISFKFFFQRYVTCLYYKSNPDKPRPLPLWILRYMNMNMNSEPIRFELGKLFLSTITRTMLRTTSTTPANQHVKSAPPTIKVTRRKR